MYLDTPDSLSILLQKLELSAEVYVNGDFCGAWAVDTSGSKRIPFHLVGDGQAWLHFEGQEPQPLSAGDLVLFPHDSSHAIANSSRMPEEDEINAEMIDDSRPRTNMICGFFEFEDKAALPLLEALPSVIVLGLNERSTQYMMKSLIELIVAELKKTQPGYYAVVDQLAYLLFVQILRQQIESQALNDCLLTALFDEKVGKAINCIHLKPEKKWTLETLASECAMGRSSFAARFNDLVGMPAMQYLSYWRMQEASRLLKKTNLALIQIAEKSGYDSEASFSKAFKKVTGHSPGAVRRLSRSKNVEEQMD